MRGRVFEYIVWMKFKALLSLLLVIALVTAVAVAQNQPAPQNPPAQQNNNAPQPEVQNNDPLYFVKIAADVTANLQGAADNRLGIYVSDKDWAEGAKDSDLGPFLKFKEAKPGRSAAFLFNEAKDQAVCVYFDGKSAFGVAAVKTTGGAAIKQDDIAAAFKPISDAMLKKNDQQLHFNPTDVNTDDGVQLPAFVVLK
jgi:hypothetical protein